MTRQEFIDRHKHKIAGLVLDAMHVARVGESGGLFARTAMVQIDSALGIAFDSLFPPEKPDITPKPKTTPGAK